MVASHGFLWLMIILYFSVSLCGCVHFCACSQIVPKHWLTFYDFPGFILSFAGPSDAPLAPTAFEAFVKVPNFLRPHTQIYCTRYLCQYPILNLHPLSIVKRTSK